jgi:hypothetical protein
LVIFISDATSNVLVVLIGVFLTLIIGCKQTLLVPFDDVLGSSPLRLSAVVLVAFAHDLHVFLTAIEPFVELLPTDLDLLELAVSLVDIGFEF